MQHDDEGPVRIATGASGEPEKLQQLVARLEQCTVTEDGLHEVEARLAGILDTPLSDGGQTIPPPGVVSLLRPRRPSRLFKAALVAAALLVLTAFAFGMVGVVCWVLPMIGNLVPANPVVHPAPQALHSPVPSRSEVKPIVPQPAIPEQEQQVAALDAAPDHKEVRPAPSAVRRPNHEAAVEPPAVPAPSQPAPTVRPPEPPTPLPGSEAELLWRARGQLALDPRQALDLAAEHAQRFANGELAQEREVIAITALEALGRNQEAASRAERFLLAYPASVHSLRVRQLHQKLMQPPPQR